MLVQYFQGFVSEVLLLGLRLANFKSKSFGNLKLLRNVYTNYQLITLG